MRGESYCYVRPVSDRKIRPFDVVLVKVLDVRAGKRDHRYKITEAVVRRTFTRRGAVRVANRFNAQEAS